MFWLGQDEVFWLGKEEVFWLGQEEVFWPVKKGYNVHRRFSSKREGNGTQRWGSCPSHTF